MKLLCYNVVMEKIEVVRLPQDILLEPGEDLVLMVRQHWFVFRDPFILMFFVPFLFLSAIFYGDIFNLGGVWRDLLGVVGLYGAGIAFGAGLLWFIWKFYLWRNTFYLLTNKRLILVSQLGLFNQDDRETGLSMIQDVRSRVKGLQATLYGFGDVTVQVSSQDAQLTLEKVGRPREIQQVIVREAHLKSD